MEFINTLALALNTSFSNPIISLIIDFKLFSSNKDHINSKIHLIAYLVFY